MSGREREREREIERKKNSTVNEMCTTLSSLNWAVCQCLVGVGVGVGFLVRFCCCLIVGICYR